MNKNINSVNVMTNDIFEDYVKSLNLIEGFSKNLYIDIHVIQTLPPSCVNRDDTGSPKTQTYGHKTRACISSQCLKRWMREHLPGAGYLTKELVKLIAKEIEAKHPDVTNEEALSAAKILLKAAGFSFEKNYAVKSMFLIGRKQIDAVATLYDKIPANLIADMLKEDKKKKEDEDGEDGNKEDKEKSKQSKEMKELAVLVNDALNANPSADISLFGRMLAKNKELSVEAASQVAPAISTHEVSNEYDYFTAVDDINKNGAGHIGTTEFNSYTAYRYANLNVGELLKAQGEFTPAIAAMFTYLFIHAMPTGNQNKFGNHAPVDMVYIALRDDSPYSFQSAFETPVKAKEDGGYIENSENALMEYVEEQYGSTIKRPIKEYFILGNNYIDVSRMTESEVISNIREEVKNYVERTENR